MIENTSSPNLRKLKSGGSGGGVKWGDEAPPASAFLQGPP